MTFSINTHQFRKGRAGASSAPLKIVPYIRLKSGDNPPIFIQEGSYYWEGGELVDPKELPDWVKPEVLKLSDRAKKEVGLTK